MAAKITVRRSHHISPITCTFHLCRNRHNRRTLTDIIQFSDTKYTCFISQAKRSSHQSHFATLEIPHFIASNEPIASKYSTWTIRKLPRLLNSVLMVARREQPLAVQWKRERGNRGRSACHRRCRCEKESRIDKVGCTSESDFDEKTTRNTKKKKILVNFRARVRLVLIERIGEWEWMMEYYLWFLFSHFFAFTPFTAFRWFLRPVRLTLRTKGSQLNKSFLVQLYRWWFLDWLLDVGRTQSIWYGLSDFIAFSWIFLWIEYWISIDSRGMRGTILVSSAFATRNIAYLFWTFQRRLVRSYGKQPLTADHK